ncbi:hypothetical protein INT47_002679 [Mucor saturninus]|uniref:Reverse transcriptase domain-containing protein n=1 Tax=Mucor saturninus TaxID=64648 RepID=A0A8H7UU75_9FUNG|nr:hypothetical protein INT47_002679 [Mucor saturninus]
MIVNRREYKYREQHPSDCFKRFEGILKSHGMSLDLNWKRLLPERLVNKEMFQLLTTFLKDQYADHTYDRFKRVFIGHFGPAANKLLSMDMSRYGSLELYTEKFNKYRALSGLTDETMLVARYLNGLMSALRKDINKCLIASGDAARSLEQIITIARRLVLSEHYENITMKRNKRDESKDENVKSKKARNVRKCKNHPNATDHFTRDCRIPKKGKKGNAKPPGVCWRCLKAPFPGDHKFVPASKKNDKPRHKYSKKHDEESDSESGESNNSDSMDTDEEDEADKKFASMSMASINKGKKPIVESDFAIAPSDLLTNKFIYVPIRVNDVKCWAFVDSGSNFSIMSTRLNKFLNLPIKSCFKNKSTIKLGESKSEVNRIGNTKDPVKLFYNNITLYSKMEILDVREDVDIVIGTDTILDSNDNHCLPPLIDPNANAPNDSPFGTEQERELVKAQLKPIIEANIAIDPASHCTLPNSHISIPTRPDYKYGYRRQFPIDEAYKSVVDEQIKTWFTNRVIEPSPPNTAYNSPIFIIKRKNPITGEYDGKKTRAILDIRMTNAALIKSKLDRFQLPRISDMHLEMGNSQIFTIIDLSNCFPSFKIKKGIHRQVTSFTYNGQQYMFQKAPFGLTHVSSFVSRCLTTLFADLKYVCTFVDDITIHTKADIHYHAECVSEVLQRLTKANLKINPDKLQLCQTKIYILGFVLSANYGLVVDHRKVSNVLDWPPITSVSYPHVCGNR